MELDKAKKNEKNGQPNPNQNNIVAKIMQRCFIGSFGTHHAEYFNFKNRVAAAVAKCKKNNLFYYS